MGVKVAIHGKPIGLENESRVQGFVAKLKQCGFEPVLSKEFAQTSLGKNLLNTNSIHTYSASDDLIGVEYVFSLGGDGTLLETLTHVARHKIPIVGINMGRLGFLATTPLEEIEKSVQSLSEGAYELDNRVLIQMNSDQNTFKEKNFALNDFAILKRDTSSMIIVKVYLNGDYLNTYWADGLIVSTPTGSTGYSLSCGGPLVLPQSNNFIITPVSPHNLNARPLVVADNSEISFKIEARNDNVLVSLDSRSEPVSKDIQITINKSDLVAKLVKFNDYNLFDTMRNKLNWGIDYRN